MLLAITAVAATVLVPLAQPAHAFNVYADRCRWGNSDSLAVIVYRNGEQAGPMNAHYRAIEEGVINNYNSAGEGRYHLQRAADNPAAPVVMEFNSHLYPNDDWLGFALFSCSNSNFNPIVYVILNQSRTDVLMTNGGVETVTAIEHQELGHSLGLDHVYADTLCNVMSDPLNLFFPGGYCEHYGTFLKKDDIDGLWWLYPTKDPPQPPHTCGRAAPSSAAVVHPTEAIHLFSRFLAQVDKSWIPDFLCV
jgi:hypothetical protein